MRAVPRRTEGSGTKVPRLRRNAGNAPSRCVQACPEEAKGIIFPTLHLVIIEDEAFETAVLGEDAGLRGDGLGGEDAVDGGEEGVAVEELAVAGELLDAVDAAVAFDLDGDVLAVGVEGHDVDGADCGGVFAADELGAGADAVDLFGEITLEVVFDAVLDEAGIDAEVIGGVGVDVVQGDFQDVAGLVGADAKDMLGGRPVRGLNRVRGDVLQSAGRSHPVERLV